MFSGIVEFPNSGLLLIDAEERCSRCQVLKETNNYYTLDKANSMSFINVNIQILFAIILVATNDCH